MLNPVSSPSDSRLFLTAMGQDLKKPDGIKRLLYKPSKKILDWAHLFFHQCSLPLDECKSILGRTGKVFSIYKFPEKVQKSAKAVSEGFAALLEGRIFDFGMKSADVYVSGTGVIGLVADGTSVCNDTGILSLSADQLLIIDTIGFLGSVALFVESLQGVVKHGKSCFDAKASAEQKKFAMMKVAVNVMMLGLSVLGMVAFLTGNVTDKLLLLSISTVVLLLSMCSYYYKKVYVSSEKSVAQ